MPDPEILNPSGELSISPISGMDAAIKSEINLQVEFAMAHPRSITAVLKEIEELVTLNQDIAEESFYTLKRKDKSGGVKLIQGPSVRFAEVLCYCWGHVRWQKQITDLDNEFVTGEGVFMDLQRNIVGKVKTKRRITDSNGRRYNADMIQTTGNAASSLAYRNAVTGSIPQALWKGILEKAKVVAVGGTASIGEKRVKALEYGAKIGVSPEQIFSTLGVQGINDIGVDELIALKGLFNSLKDGETTVEEAFGDPYETEINAIMDQLGWNQGRKTTQLTNYRGRSVELLAYLRKQVEPLNGGQAKAEEKPKEQPAQEEKTEAAQGEAAKPKRGRAAKDTAPKEEPKEEDTTQTTTGSATGGSEAETKEKEVRQEKKEDRPGIEVPGAGSFNF